MIHIHIIHFMMEANVLIGCDAHAKFILRSNTEVNEINELLRSLRSLINQLFTYCVLLKIFRKYSYIFGEPTLEGLSYY